jgi:tetratricopeptide (TPR) repeat protein
MSYELAETFLNKAAELVETGEENFVEILDNAEQIAHENASILCRSARLLFRFGLLNSKGRFFLLALEKLERAFKKDPLFFETRSVWRQLWGNTWVQLGKLTNDPSCFENALEKFMQGAALYTPHPDKPPPEDLVCLYWDWAEAWVLLGQKSGEKSDFQQGLAKFEWASQYQISSPFFRLDYSHALVLYGQLIGNPDYLDAAMDQLREIISQTSDPPSTSPSFVHIIAWRKMAFAAKIRYQLTHRDDHFQEADRYLRDAILSGPQNGALWLDWGELFLYGGWLRRDLKLIETGLEKLTTEKIKECDPVRTACYLGMGMIMLGLFLENFKYLKEGQIRILNGLEVAPQYPPLLHAEGFAHLALGLYFSDPMILARAAALFDHQIQNSGGVDSWYALFQTYMAAGLHAEDLSLLRKGIHAIRRVCELRPYSPIHLNEWGIALLRTRHFENDKDTVQACIEEAIFLFEKAWMLHEEEETLYNWGCAYDLLGDITGDEEHYGKAIDLLSKVLDKKPHLLYARYHLGLALSHLGELILNADCLIQAVELLDAVAKIESDDEDVWNDLGYALLNLTQILEDPVHPREADQKRHEAEKTLLHAAALGSGDACYHLACLYSLSGLYPSALQYLQKARTAHALPSIEDLQQDDWLKGVRSTEGFQDFLTLQEGGNDG